MQKKLGGRPPSPNSRRAAGRRAHVSERMLYYSQEVARSGREDLKAAVARGEMTIAAAIRELRGTTLPDRYDKLVLAWNRCSDDDQVRFLMVSASLGLVTLGTHRARSVLVERI